MTNTPIEKPTPVVPACAPTEPFIDKAEVGKRLGMRPRTIDDWMERGLLPFYKLGRSVRFKWSEVEAHLADVKGHGSTSAVAIQCTLEARLTGLASVVVKEQADNNHQAIDGAVRKLQRSVGSEISKHDPRRHHVQPGTRPADDADEEPA